MKFIIAFLSALLMFFYASAQKSRDMLYQFPANNLSNYNVAAETLYNKIIVQQYKGISKKQLKSFAEEIAEGKEDFFLTGNVYIGWDKMEQYLNNILQKILPDSLKGNPDIHVYPTRIAEVNAYAMFDGSLFFNVGFFANVTNEASIAIILAHELGHYMMKDGLYDYIKATKINRKEIKANGISKKLKYAFEYMSFSRAQEARADSIGFLLAKKAGYDLYYGIDNFKRFQELETAEDVKKAPSRVIYPPRAEGQLTRSDIIKLLQTHPENSERIEKLNTFILNDSTGVKLKFIVSESDFRELQEVARYESLNILLNSDLRTCIQNSFLYYLYQPGNADYLYYLVESMRRYISADYKVEDDCFLTEDFLGKQFKKGEGILHHLSYLIVDSVKYSQLQPSDLTDTNAIAFEKYRQAFAYFSNIAEKQNNREALLSIALTQKDTVIQNQYLTKYLSFDDCWYKDYAIALKNNEVNSIVDKNTKNIILYSRPEYYEITRFGLHREYKHEIKLGDKILAKYALFIHKKTPASVLSRLDDPSYINMNDVDHYYNLLYASDYAKENDTITRYDTEKKCSYKVVIKGLDVFSYNPENWEFVKKDSIKSFSEYDTYGIQYSLAKRIENGVIASVVTFGLIIPYMIIFPQNIYSFYSYYSFDLVKNNSNYQYEVKTLGLRPSRYFRRLHKLMK
jgi:Zn-dependent protease with chaperone function